MIPPPPQKKDEGMNEGISQFCLFSFMFCYVTLGGLLKPCSGFRSLVKTTTTIDKDNVKIYIIFLAVVGCKGF